MDHSAITFAPNKNDEGVLMGFSLTAVETYAECFCVTFPYAQAKGKARVEFVDDKIRFIHDGIGSDETPEQLGIYGGSEGGVYESPIEVTDATSLADFFARRGIYEGMDIRFRLEQAWGKGFSLAAKPK